MKKIILFLSLILISLTFVSAQSSFIYKQGQNFTLSVIMASNDLSTCTTCTCAYSVTYPNGTALLTNQAGTNNNGYCELVAKIDTLGTYGAEMTFTNGADNGRVTFNFDITATGYDLTLSKSIIVLIGFIALFILAMVFFIFGVKVDNIAVKLFCLGLAALFLVFMFGYEYNTITQSIGEFSSITGNIGIVYTLLIALLTVGGIGMVVWLVAYSLSAFAKYRGYKD